MRPTGPAYGKVPDFGGDGRQVARARILGLAREARASVGDDSDAGIIQHALQVIGPPEAIATAMVYHQGQKQEELRQELFELLARGKAEGWL